MSIHPETTRRDLRHRLRRGIAFMDFETDERLQGDLTSVSPAGLTFEVNGGESIEEDRTIQAARVLIGECAIEGDFVVKHIRHVSDSRIEAGGMFYPSSHTGAEKWSAVVAAIGAICEADAN